MKSLMGLFLVFVIGIVAWSILPSDINERAERACSPVSWLGRFTAAITGTFAPSGKDGVREWFLYRNSDCKKVFFDVFVEDEYAKRNAALEGTSEGETNASGVAGIQSDDETPVIEKEKPENGMRLKEQLEMLEKSRGSK